MNCCRGQNPYPIPAGSINSLLQPPPRPQGGSYFTLTRLEIWHKSILVAKYSRSYRQQQVFYQLEHYLPALERKPRAVWNAAPVKRSGLDEQILDYGKHLSDKELVKVLQLTVTYGRDRVLEAVLKAGGSSQYSFESVRFYILQELNQTRPAPPRLDVMAGLPNVQPVDLAVYDRLIEGGVR